ncbi:MAG: ProQ/FinO family protein [Legionella longbeachae]|nr:ProQ/FinO family protein [Legionella longbeachae]
MRKQELHPRTAVINKAQKINSKKARTDALLWLAANFPLAFDNSVQIRPLKAKIMDDILFYADKAAEVGISKSKLREAVVIFTRRLDYLACLKLREMRVDLQGNEVSEVTAEEADYAATKIKKRVEKSVKNARKIMSEKNTNQASTNLQSTSFHSKIANQSSSSDDYLPTYPARPVYSTPTVQMPPRATVVVKHKTTKQYDPDAVARLKEKLGLSRTLEEKKEIIE